MTSHYQKDHSIRKKGRPNFVFVSTFSYQLTHLVKHTKAVTLGLSFFLAAFVISVLASSIFTPINSSDATTVTTNIGKSDYYISIDSNDVTLDLSSSVTGAYAIASDTITTKTNAPKGYKLYVSMENDADCNKTTGECDGSGTGSNIVPGNALYKDGDSTISPYISPASGTFSSPGILDMNTWGVSDSAISTGQESTFYAMPLLPNLQLIQTTNVANISGTTKNVYFGVRADYSMPTGSYSNTIVYTASANANASGNNELSITPNSAATLNGGESVTVLTSLYTSYPLTTSDVTVTIGGDTCTVTAVSTNTNTGTKEITCTTPSFTKSMQKNLDIAVNIPLFSWNYTLTGGYAIPDSFWNITYMQQMTSGICNMVYTPSNVTGSSASIITDAANYTATAAGTSQVPQRTLYDTRDSKTYAVRKLADGNCWMVQNLDLDLSTSKTLTDSDTNLVSASSWTPTRNTWTSTGSTTGTSSAYSYSPGDIWYVDGTTSTTTRPSNAIEAAVRYVGNFYNWYAATAGSQKSGMSANQEATDSICPKGWKLPYSGTAQTGSKSFLYLLTSYNIATSSEASVSKALGSPLSFIMPGYYHYSEKGMFGQGTLGLYWSSTAQNSSNTYVFLLDQGGLNAQAGADQGSRRASLFSIRCVAL